MRVRKAIGMEAHQKIEQQISIVAEPWWIPPAIRIAPDVETVTKEHDRLREVNLITHMQVFIDGSDIEGRVGAAVWEPHRKWKKQIDIGPSD